MSEHKRQPTNVEIDRKLESGESRKIAEAVRLLPDDELSLAWRSELNAKLSASIQSKRHRFTIARTLGWVAGVGLSVGAAAVLFLMLLPANMPKGGTNPSETLESQLLAAHISSVSSSDVAGEGLSSLDETEMGLSSPESEWQKEDLEPL